MESMIHLFWVGTIFSLERKEKGLWVQYTYMKVEITVLDDLFLFFI